MELRILSGLHRGAVLELDENAGTLMVGASPQADVLMADPGFAEIHCRLSLRAGQWHIEPAEGHVFDAQGRPITAAMAIEQGASYCLADVWVGFHADGEPWAPPPTAVQFAHAGPANARYPRLRTSIAGGMLALLILPLAAWFISSAWGRVGQQAAAPKAGAAPTAASAAQAALSPASLADVFTRGLAERELTDRLELDLDKTRWEIRGSLDADEHQRFERWLLHFTETRKPGFPIHVTLVNAADLLPFKVVEVISGKGAGIVTDGGDRLYVGDTLQGYRLSAVDPGKVVFMGKRRIEVVL